jgi:hypothetical protein
MKSDRFVLNTKLGTVIDTNTDSYVAKSGIELKVGCGRPEVTSGEIRLDILTDILNDFENRLRWYEERLNALEPCEW